MTHKSDRLFQLTNLIRARQPVSTNELAEEIGVSIRTIYRYIDDLSVLGIPVYHEHGQGYRLHDGYELAPLSLTQEELDALVTGVRLVQSWTGDRLSLSAQTLLHKIQAASQKNLNDLNFKNVEAPILFDRQQDASHWDTIRLAIRKAQTLYIHYNDKRQQHTERPIHPLNLSFWGNKWTVGTWCHLRQSYRDFRLDRIASVTPASQQRLPDHVNLENYLQARSKMSVCD